MNYSSVAHLSNQFKDVTGLSPSHYKHMKDKRRIPLEELGNSNGLNINELFFNTQFDNCQNKKQNLQTVAYI